MSLINLVGEVLIYMILFGIMLLHMHQKSLHLLCKHDIYKFYSHQSVTEQIGKYLIQHPVKTLFEARINFVSSIKKSEYSFDVICYYLANNGNFI